MDKNIYIHVGMMKTATTYLQKYTFPKLDGDEIYYVKTDNEIFEILRELIDSNPHSFDIKKAKKQTEKILSTISQKSILISWEALIGSTYDNFWSHDFIKHSLKSIFNKVFIIMVIRRQDDLVQSLYIQSLQEGYCKSVKRFVNYRNKTFSDYRSTLKFGVNIDIKQLNYNIFYKSYLETFSKENVIVLPYELFKENNNEFMNKLCKFIGTSWDTHKDKMVNGKVEANKSYSKISIWLAYLFNRFIIKERTGIGFILEKPFTRILYGVKNKSKTANLLYRFFSCFTLRNFLKNVVDKIIYIKPSPINNQMKAEIMKMHNIDNKKLGSSINMNLSDYGY